MKILRFHFPLNGTIATTELVAEEPDWNVFKKNAGFSRNSKTLKLPNSQFFLEI